VFADYHCQVFFIVAFDCLLFRPAYCCRWSTYCCDWGGFSTCICDMIPSAILKCISMVDLMIAFLHYF